MIFNDGTSYDGQWSCGTFSGYGTFTWPDGKVYKGKIYLMQGIMWMEKSKAEANSTILKQEDMRETGKTVNKMVLASSIKMTA